MPIPPAIERMLKQEQEQQKLLEQLLENQKALDAAIAEASRLRKLRTQMFRYGAIVLELSLQALANASGVSRQAVRAYISMQIEPQAAVASIEPEPALDLEAMLAAYRLAYDAEMKSKTS